MMPSIFSNRKVSFMEHEFQFFSDTDDLAECIPHSEDAPRTLKVCLDKWLWAARFFKTRALARAAIEDGKVFYNGELPRPSRGLEIGVTLQIGHGRYEKTVMVKGLSTRRRNTTDALQLFEEQKAL